MATLRFRVARSQLGGLVFVIGAAAFVALILVANLRVPDAGNSAIAARGRGVAIDAVVIAAMVVPFTLVFLLARTEFTPSGIRARTLFWWRLLTWDKVAQISVGRKWGFFDGLIVTTTSGEPFPLTVPVSGGPLADPDFDHKAEQILDYWRTFGSGTVDGGMQAGLFTELPDE